MDVPKSKRQRGVIPTPQGLKKLQEALLSRERDEAFEFRLTQEKISEETGLAMRTIRKVLNREGMVSLSTLTTLFSAFDLELEADDYIKPKLQEEEFSVETPVVNAQNRIDWGEAVDVSAFQGRQDELAQLQQWIVRDRCRLVALLGMGGIGKTSLSVKLAEQLQADFDCIIWRSLRHAPPVETLISEWVKFLSLNQEKSAEIRYLIPYLRSSRCLLVLDNVESILQPGQYAGHYQKGYEGYGELFKTFGETSHQSCLVLTSREKPSEIAALEGSALSVHSLLLGGCAEAARALLVAKGLAGSGSQQQQLADRFGNSPLAIKLIAASIQELFDGDIGQFLAQETVLFNGVRSLLAHQFERLSPLEQSVMYWLSVNREWTDIPQLSDDIVPAISRLELLEALESLIWRSLIEKQHGKYTQQPVVMEYTTERLLERVTGELVQCDRSPNQINLLKSHPLLKAQSQDSIRAMQIRLLLAPLSQKLLRHFGSTSQVQAQLSQILQAIRTHFPTDSNYLAGNLLNLLGYLKTDLSGCDLSGLTIWQADFRGMNLHRVNLQNANLAKSIFSKTFGSVYALAFSQDDRLLATGHADGEICLWQVSTGQLLSSLQGHSSSVWTVAFSPDEQTLASGSFDQTIKLWNLATGLESKTLSGHSDWVRAVCFSPDGRLLASCSSDRTLKLWDSSTFSEIQTWTGHEAPVTAIAFSPQGTFLVSGSEDCTLRLWDVESYHCVACLKGHTNPISSVAFSADGQTLASCEEQSIKLWPLDTQQCDPFGDGFAARTLQGNLTLVWAVAFSPDGQTLAGSDGQTLRLWDVQTGTCRQIFSGFTSQVWALAFSTNGKTLVGSDAQRVRLWNVETGECLRTWQNSTDCVGTYWSLAFSPDAQTLASGGSDGAVRIWNVNSGEYLKTLQKHDRAVRVIAFSSGGQILASGGEDRAIQLWELQTGTVRQALVGHGDTVRSVAFSPIPPSHGSYSTWGDPKTVLPPLSKGGAGEILASGSSDRSLRLWEVKTGHCLNILSGHDAQVLSVAFSPDGEIVASASEDRTLKLWNANTGACLRTLLGHQGWIWSVAFSRDGQLLASGSEDRTIKLWDVKTGRCLATLQGHTKLIWSLLFSPGDRTLISGSTDRSAKVWDLKTYQCLKTFDGDTDLLWAFAYAQNTSLLASGSNGEMIQLWELQTGKLLKSLSIPKLYEDMNITGVTGLMPAANASLKNLGAIEV